MLSDKLRTYLKICGCSDRKLRKISTQTRLYHDLGIYGDIAEIYMETLEEDFSVDMSEFDFYEYFPPEFAGKTIFESYILSVIPVLRWYLEKRQNKYIPITLEMIETSMEQGFWKSPEPVQELGTDQNVTYLRLKTPK